MLIRSSRAGVVRRGLAPLEFTMVAPLLVALAALIFTIGMAALQKAEAIVQARGNAWQVQKAPPVGQPPAGPLTSWGQTPLTGSPFTGVGPPPDSGKVTGQGSRQFTPFIKMSMVPKAMTAQHVVLQGSWAQDAIAYQAGSPLTPSPLLMSFVGSQANFLNVFQDLQTLFGAAKSSGNVSNLLNTIPKLAKDIQTLVQDLQAIQKAIGQIVNAMSLTGTKTVLGVKITVPAPDIPGALAAADTLVSAVSRLPKDVGVVVSDVGTVASELGVTGFSSNPPNPSSGLDPSALIHDATNLSKAVTAFKNFGDFYNNLIVPLMTPNDY